MSVIGQGHESMPYNSRSPHSTDLWSICYLLIILSGLVFWGLLCRYESAICEQMCYYTTTKQLIPFLELHPANMRKGERTTYNICFSGCYGYSFVSVEHTIGKYILDLIRLIIIFWLLLLSLLLLYNSTNLQKVMYHHFF